MPCLLYEFTIEIGFRISAEIRKICQFKITSNIFIHIMNHPVHYIFGVFFAAEFIAENINKQERTQKVGKAEVGIMHVVHGSAFIQGKENFFKQVEPFSNARLGRRRDGCRLVKTAGEKRRFTSPEMNPVDCPRTFFICSISMRDIPGQDNKLISY